VPEEFYGLIGRVTMVAAVLENRLITLLTELTADPQAKHAGKMAGALMDDTARALLGRKPEFRNEGDELIRRLKIVFDGRNEIVHSLWPNPTLDRAWGHRSVREKNRPNPGDISATVETNEAAMTALIHEMISLYSDVEQFGLKSQLPENRAQTL
jgi:hypothetical protein